MVRKHNRQMSFSMYISALAVSDTLVLTVGTYISTFPEEPWHETYTLFCIPPVYDQ